MIADRGRQSPDGRPGRVRPLRAEPADRAELRRGADAGHLVRPQPGHRRGVRAGVPTSSRSWTTTTCRARTGSGSCVQRAAGDRRRPGLRLLAPAGGPAAAAWLRNTRYFRPPAPEDRNRFGLPAWAGTYNVLMARRCWTPARRRGGPFRRVRALRRRGQRSVHPRQGGRVPPCLRAPVHRRAGLGTAPHDPGGHPAAAASCAAARASISPGRISPPSRCAAWPGRAGASSASRWSGCRSGWSRTRLVGGLLSLSHALGEIYAWAGMRYDYYLRRRG